MPASSRPLTRFPNRFEAGRQLAVMLQRYRGRDDAILFALPRGGVEVAYAVCSDTAQSP
jgi:predicted phosphoribosyltransferase